MNADTTIPELISVVMPSYNAAGTLRKSIDCVLDQSWSRTELIIVDDGSTDDSVEVIKSYGDRVTLIEQPNSGPGPARNRGITAARGEFIAFLDADDWWTPDCLEKLHAALQDSPAGLAYCGWQNVGSGSKGSAPFVPPDFEMQAMDKAEAFLSKAARWPIHAALTRRRVLDDAGGGFDEQWPTCMDFDLWLRIGLAGPIVLVPERLAFYLHHSGTQITSKEWRQAINVWRVKRHYVAKYPQTVAHLSRARLRELIDGGLLRRGYDAFWRRDLGSARRIFQTALRTGYWKIKDLKILLPALLPEAWFIALVRGRN